MKNTLNPWAPCLLAALSLALQGWGMTSQAAGEEPQLEEELMQPSECHRTESPTVYNKASHLIGMKVENQAGQALGRIKDIVVDGEAERVSYAVLAVNSGFLGARQRLHAVPLSALRPNGHGHRLVLNAERKNLELAQGFPADQWPSAFAPSWGAAPPWKEASDLVDAGPMPRKAGREIPERYPPGSLGYPGF